MPKKDKQRLLDEVHATEESLVKAAALRWTVENLGQSWPEVDRYGQLLEMHMDGISEDQEAQDEMEESLEAELADWTVDARKHVRQLVERKLALTLANVERSFHGELK